MKKSAFLLPLVPLLVSAAPVTFEDSIVTVEKVKARERLAQDSKTAQALANVTNNIAAEITFSYEVYQLENPSVMITGYQPAYALIYRVDIYLSDDVHYKGGVGNWFSGNHPCYLNSLDISASFSGCSNLKNYFQTPQTSESVTSEVKAPIGIAPTAGVQKSDYNTIDYDPLINGSLTTCSSLTSVSYLYGFTQLNIDYRNDNKIYDYENRLVARYKDDITQTNNSIINFSQHFDYGKSMTYDDGTHGRDKGVYTESMGDFFSGPDLKAGSFDFSFYGAMDFESDTKPSSVKIDVTMETVHGSDLVLDRFYRTSTLSFNSNL